MCYSAQVEQELKVIRAAMKAKTDLAAFENVFRKRLTDDRIKIPKAMEANFYYPESEDEERIHALIKTYQAQQSKNLEAELFKQKTRLVKAEKALESGSTKKALEDQRISSSKVESLLKKIGTLKRQDVKPTDARIFPMSYTPVVIVEKGERLIRPMRYHCRPEGKPAFYDTKYPGLYNARRDNLERFWKGQFGHTHAIVLMTGFYENVSKHRVEGRDLRPGEKEENVILHFIPRPAFLMQVACLWSHWDDGNEALDSFAAITDEPPQEVSAAGHDRCIIPLTAVATEQWLDSNGILASAMNLLDQRERPFYEHRMAA